MLIYRRVDNLEVAGYTNSDLGGCSDDRRSNFGYVFMMAEGAISWKSKKQTLIPSSILQVEFIAYFATSIHVM